MSDFKLFAAQDGKKTAARKAWFAFSRRREGEFFPNQKR
jgi:hypothetical protein